MEKDLIQEFLKAGLFDIGDKDDRLEHLKKSITDLYKKFEDDLSLLPRYTLVALDPKISEDEPILKEVEEIVTQYWQTIRARHNEMPIQIYRGIILSALHEIGDDNPIPARIIYLIASTFYPYSSLGSEKSVVKEILEDLGEVSEQHAVEEWSLSEDEPSLRFSRLNLNSSGDNSFSTDQLKSGMLTAIQKSENGQEVQRHGGNSQWGRHFAEKSSKAISNAINEAIKGISTVQAEKALNDAFKSFKKSIKKNIRNTYSSLFSVQRRSKLVFWKETLYSHSKNESYRDLNPDITPIVMSADLNKLLPKVTPISVDYLLRETLYSLNGEDKEVRLEDYFKKIIEAKGELVPYFNNDIPKDGRISIVNFVGLLLNGETEIKNFNKRTGLSLDNTIKLQDFSVAVLHQFLVNKLVQQ